MRIGAAALVAVLATVASACGGGGSERLSRDQFAKKADTVCRDVDERTRAVAVPDSIEKIPDYVSKVLPIFDDGLSRLRELQPPSNLEDAVRRWLDSLSGGRDLVANLGEAADAGDIAEVQAVGVRATRSSNRTHAIARSLGLTDCASA
jgi:hypothetical protein